MQFFKSVVVLALAAMATAEKTVTVYAACAPTSVAIVPTGGAAVYPTGGAYPVTSGAASPTGSPVVPVVVGSTGLITPPAPTTSPIYANGASFNGASFGALVFAGAAALLL